MEAERPLILTKTHEGIAGRHYAKKATVQKILRDGLWWPTLHKDSKEYYRACDVCQRVGKPYIRDYIPLEPQLTLQVFEKWSIDFVGLINPLGRHIGARYIITATNYFTRWEKARAVKDYSAARAV
jgi:hypothetical protein